MAYQGDTVVLAFGNGKVITVLIEDVSASRVTFRNSVTREVAYHSPELLPGGMQRGGGSSIVPAGITDADAPIDVSGAGSAGTPNIRYNSPGSLSSSRR